MEWLITLFSSGNSGEISSLQGIILIMLIISIGNILGKIKIKGIALGTAAIMFVGLLAGHFGYSISIPLSEFLRDFGIILFLYVMGLQVGPFFFSSFQKQGFIFNFFAIGTVLLGVFLSLLIYYFSGYGIDTITGLMSGAVTNTPGLGAAQSVLNDISKTTGTVFHDPASAYAIGYPVGVFGIIFVIAISKFLLRVDVSKEIEKYLQEEKISDANTPKVIRCKIQNPQINGKTLQDILEILGNENINISRIRFKNEKKVKVPTKETILHLGDDVVILGLEIDLKRVQPLLGEEIFDMSLEESQDVLTRSFVVTRKSISGKPVEVSKIQSLYGVKITRITRGDIEFVATSSNKLLFGDHVIAVGTEKDLQRFEALIGNNKKYLSESNLTLVTLGLILGIVIGSIPIIVPGLSSPLKIGIAAGSLIVALFISRYAPTYGISVYMNKGSASFLKDLGISLFFAVVGLKAGAHFYETFVHNDGLMWVVFAFSITTIPLLIMMFFGFFILKIPFLPLIGLIAASYTDSIALLFSNSYFKTEIPNHAYAITYPIANISRIIMAQLMILFFI